MIIGLLFALILYVITPISVVLAFVGGAAHADVLDYHNSLAAQLAHQIFAAHLILLNCVADRKKSYRGWLYRFAKRRLGHHVAQFCRLSLCN